jgi:hypothetical protein
VTLFLRVLSEPPDTKGQALRDKIRRVVAGRAAVDFDVEAAVFHELPRGPFAYWSSPQLRDLFTTMKPFEGPNRSARVGLQTSDDFRFIRSWWETKGRDDGPKRWFTFVRGGKASKYYGALNSSINWEGEGKELKAWAIHSTRGEHWSKNIRSADTYLRPGITWPLRAADFSPYPMPAQSLFSIRGAVAFCGPEERDAVIGLFGSRAFDRLFKLLLGRTEYPEFSIGTLQLLPMPERLDPEIGALARRAWSLKRDLSTGHETTHDFIAPARLLSCSSPVAAVDAKLCELQREIDAIAQKHFGLNEADLDALDANASAELFDAPNDIVEDDADPADDDVISVISWAVGVVFARFDIRLATGERAVPPEPDPFDPLPAKSPGMLPDGDAPFMTTTGVFVDDSGHADDLAARVTAVYERVGETPPAPDALRKTLAKDFFPAHIRMYSKSRRKAPIYWQLATPSASYSVWLYIHAFGKDTLFRVQNDYVAPKLAHERRELEGLLAEAGPSATTAQSRAIEAQTTFIEELSALLDEVRRVAPLWDPDLDDGVILNFAPLWRMVPQNRAWQKELRAAWAALVDGDYDWAHLSMRLWPERVVPKCAKDRSLAIAHDLEDVFWFEDAAGKWQPRPTPTRPVDDLIAERTSVAVKAALQSLLEAPDPVATSGRGRRKKS